MPNGLGPAQQRLAKGHLGAHVQVIASPFEGRVLCHLQRQDHGTRNCARPLIGHAWKGEALTVAHAFLDLGIDHCHLLLALLFALDLLLLLHEHAGAHLSVHHPHFVGATTTSLTLGGVGFCPASTAHDPSLDLSPVATAVVQFFQAHGQIRVAAFLNLALFRLFDGLHAPSVVEDLLVRVVQDLVCIPHFTEFPLGFFIRVLVRMVLDGQFSIDLLDVCFISIVLKA
eukprot:Skav234309  [mRNA]  locus=scaffold3022:10493:29764:+ [translate_table: standard]